MWPGNGSLSGDLKSKWHAFLFGRKTLLPSDPRIIDFAIEGVGLRTRTRITAIKSAFLRHHPAVAAET
jgi:hypothetical protein